MLERLKFWSKTNKVDEPVKENRQDEDTLVADICEKFQNLMDLNREMADVIDEISLENGVALKIMKYMIFQYGDGSSIVVDHNILDLVSKNENEYVKFSYDENKNIVLSLAEVNDEDKIEEAGVLNNAD